MSAEPGSTSTRPNGVLFSFAAGIALATVACGGILAARLSQGNVHVALVAHVFLTLAVVAIMFAQRRPVVSSVPSGAAAMTAQVVGACLGITLAHALLRTSAFAGVPWLSERPAQLVNDAVAVFGPLAVIWASSRRPPNTTVLVTTLALVTAYRLTGVAWHLDAGRFTYTVQDLVTGEFAGSAVGISVFRLLTVG